MGRGKPRMCNTEVVLIGMLWLSTILIMPSSAQQCWKNIVDCLDEHFNQTSKPEFDSSSPSFNGTEFFCCPLIQETAQNEKPCFCEMNTAVHQNPTNGTGVLKLLSFCDVTDSESLDSFDTFCSDVSTLPSTPPQSSGPPAPASVNLFPPLDAKTPSQATPAPHSPRSPALRKKTILIIAVAVSSAALLFLTALGVILFSIKASKKPHGSNAGMVTERNVPQSKLTDLPPPGPPAPVLASQNDIITPESLQYEFGHLKAATNNFSDYHRIRGDGFGVVYKGTLPNGKEVAIKRLSSGCWQGDQQFMNEVTLVAKLQHRNLVRLVGFCLVNEERLLVYEFVHNRSLDYILFDPELQKQLDWSIRYKIIGGIARGLLYLHEDSPTRIIHRDLKAANILLDTEMNPKISDFGMARIFHFEQTHGDTKRIVGTHGYMAPEYLLLGQFSIKSDVYSFGVLILEIVSGKKISSLMYPSGSAGENLLSYAWRCFRDGRPLDFMDPTLRHSQSRNEVVRCIHLGLQCIQDDPRRRPTMGKVVVMLNSDSDVGGLLLPEYPGGLQARYAEQSTSNTNYMP